MTDYDDLRTRMQYAHVWHMHRETWEDVVKKARPVMDEARDAIKALQVDIKHLIAGIEEKSDDLKDVRDELTCEQERVQELKAQLADCQEELAYAKAQHHNACENITNLEAQLSTARLDGAKDGLEAAANRIYDDGSHFNKRMIEAIRAIDPTTMEIE